MEICETPLIELRQMLDNGDVTAKEVVYSFYERIQHVQGQFRPFVHQMPIRELMIQADDADDWLRTGRAGVLTGIPIAVKSSIAVKDMPNDCSSAVLEGYLAPYDAEAVHNLRECGAIVMGLTDMDEFAMGNTCQTSVHGGAKNPWDFQRVSGGSSGGSASAVMSGCVAAALGSDTGGSIRQPAAFCNAVGFLPTYGNVSRFGNVAYGSSLEQIGPLTRTVKDAAFMLDAMTNPDSNDSTHHKWANEDFSLLAEGELDNLRVGWCPESFGNELDENIRQSLENTRTVFEKLGAEVVNIELPHLQHAVATYYVIAMSEASSNLSRFDGMRYGKRVSKDNLQATYKATRREGFGEEVRRRILMGTFALTESAFKDYYRKAAQVRELIRRDFMEAFDSCDVILAPVSPFLPPRPDEIPDDPLTSYLADMYTVPANLAGICAMSLPCGRTPSGLPIGMQLMAAPFREDFLLQCGVMYQDLTHWHKRPAPIKTSGLSGPIPIIS